MADTPKILPPLMPLEGKEPPKPLGPDVRIVTAEGRPTAEYHRFLTLQYEWLAKLRLMLMDLE